MIPNYAFKVREDLNKLLDAIFIYPIETMPRLFPLVIMLKKNGKLRICMDYQKLNAQTKKGPFPLPFLDSILDYVVGHEMYSFMDGYSRYNQVKMVEINKDNFLKFLEWGAYAYDVMSFGLCNAPTTFQKIITKVFFKYLNDFMQVFLDDFSVYSNKKDRLK